METKEPRHIMGYCEDDVYMDLDLCCFCKKTKDLLRSGECEYYELFSGSSCDCFDRVEDQSQRIQQLLKARGVNIG